jgi:hypothetical protein
VPEGEEKEMSFWKDVRELRDLIKLKLLAGHGTRSLVEAMKEQVRNAAVQSVEGVPEVEAGLKKLPPQLAARLMEVPPGQQLKMTAKEYAQLAKKE